jgi:hypothetical protein
VNPRVPKPEVLTFEQVVRDWYERHIVPSKSEKYARKVISILERFLFPHIGARPINEIHAPEILVPLRAIEA